MPDNELLRLFQQALRHEHPDLIGSSLGSVPKDGLMSAGKLPGESRAAVSAAVPPATDQPGRQGSQHSSCPVRHSNSNCASATVPVITTAFNITSMLLLTVICMLAAVPAQDAGSPLFIVFVKLPLLRDFTLLDCGQASFASPLGKTV